MSYQCQHCHKGVAHGSMVSHAKNRLHRLFKPNLQKLVVFINGKLALHVKFCTSCIKRLKKDGHLGNLYHKKFVSAVAVKAAPMKVAETLKREVKIEKKVLKKEVAKEAPKLDIEAIVGKKK